MSVAPNKMTLINVFSVEPENQEKLLDLLTRATEEFVGHAPGFMSAVLHRSLDGAKVTMVAQWEGLAAYEAMRQDPGPRLLLEEALTIARFKPGVYEAVQSFTSALA